MWKNNIKLEYSITMSFHDHNGMYPSQRAGPNKIHTSRRLNQPRCTPQVDNVGLGYAPFPTPSQFHQCQSPALIGKQNPTYHQQLPMLTRPWKRTEGNARRSGARPPALGAPLLRPSWWASPVPSPQPRSACLPCQEVQYQNSRRGIPSLLLAENSISSVLFF